MFMPHTKQTILLEIRQNVQISLKKQFLFEPIEYLTFDRYEFEKAIRL